MSKTKIAYLPVLNFNDPAICAPAYSLLSLT